jgi:hypothetical protein
MLACLSVLNLYGDVRQSVRTDVRDWAPDRRRLVALRKRLEGASAGAVGPLLDIEINFVSREKISISAGVSILGTRA